MFKTLGQGVLDLFYPYGCCACGKKIPPGIFCAGCYARIEPLTVTAVPYLFSAVRYREPIVTAIHRFKYRGEVFLAPYLAEFLIELCRRRKLNERIDCIVPVPLHPTRFRERNFNQSELLGCEIAACFSLPVLNQLLIRCRNTPSQTGLSGKERRANVAGAFQVRKDVILKGRRCLLVDDVLTTGATLSACRNRLLASGAEEVYGLTLARD
ncbi:MAG: ComF family protein [Candidatus Omnitrophica bacterium]|nr:ComF family protein [Candidatus Omnitrophota bacterium]